MKIANIISQSGRIAAISIVSLALGSLAFLTMSSPALGQGVVTKGLTLSTNGVIVSPTNFWSTNAAGITNAIGAHFAPASGSTNYAPAVAFTNAPAANSSGIPGSLIKNGNYLYLCTGTNSWHRIELLTW